MRDWPTSAARWIRRLIGQGEETGERVEEQRIVASGALAVLATEAMSCSALCLQSRRGARPHQDVARALNAFGRPVDEQHYESARAAIAAACGMTMTGVRAAAFLSGDRLAEVHDQLYAAAGRRLPVVIHADSRAVPRQSRAFGSGHEGYHSVAATGAFLAFARNAQHAVDLTLAAHRIAELSLTPGVVAMDGPETALAAQDLVLPEPVLVTAYLGAADASVEVPNQAQRMLFGVKRPNLPRWFDLDRPAAFGTAQAGDDYGVASAGRKLFFDDALPELIRTALTELSSCTARDLGFIHTHNVAKAKHVIVAQGSVVELAEAVADYVAKARKQRVGVLSVDFLRPFPAEAIAEVLHDVEVVTVLERTDDPLGQAPPLMADVSAAAPGPDYVSAIYGVGGKSVTAGDLLAVCDNMALQRPARKSRVFVGMGAVAGESAKSRLPKRQVLLDGVHRAYPDLHKSLLPPAGAIDLRPTGARSVSVHCSTSTVPEEGLTSLAEALAEGSGPYVRSRSHVVAHRVWEGVVTVSPTPLKDHGDEVAVDMAFVNTLDLPDYVNPLRALVDGGVLVLNLGLAAYAVWARLPRTWRQLIVDHGIKVYNTSLTLTHLGEPLNADSLGGEGHPFEPVLPGPLEGEDTRLGQQLPALIKRVGRTDTEMDSPSRFWGEVIQPRMLGEAPQAVPDPYLAVGAVPASTATFRDASPSRTSLPLVDPAACTGCGVCWISCPDSSLGPVAVSVQGLLDTAADLAGTEGPEAGKLRRTHGKIAAQVGKVLTKDKAKVLSSTVIREAFTVLSDKGSFKAEEKEGVDAAFDATLGAIGELPLAVTDTFFHAAEAAKPGSGEIFVLGVNPQTCQGCTSCVMNCPDDAIHMAHQDVGVLRRSAAGWRVFEALPDTPAATIERVRRELGLAAVHLQRHCHLAVAGGSASEPGSGARLASRLVAGAIEFHGKAAKDRLSGALGSLVGRMRHHIRDSLSGAFDTDDLAGLGEALAGVSGRAASVGSLVAQIEQRGDAARVDAVSLRRLATLASSLEEARSLLETGPNGIGRARMGLVVTAGEVGEWAARFPHNPFYAPLAVDLGGDGAELAAGIMRGLLDRYTELFRMARRGALRLEGKPDLSLEEKALNALTWRDLSPSERAGIPPLVLLADAESLGTKGLSGLSQLLASDLPVRVVMLDRRAEVGAHVDPTLFALAHRKAFVVAGSIAYPEHLFEGVVAALKYPGPAMIHVIAPSPGRDGFATGISRDRAREAVLTRVHPLVTYDPAGEGVFGARIDLSANPEPSALWVSDEERGPLTPAHWATGHDRARPDLTQVEDGTPVSAYLELDADAREDTTPIVTTADGQRLALSPKLVAEVEDRRAHWTTLQELAGLVTPFTRDVRERAEQDLATAHSRDMSSLRHSYEAQLAEARATTRQEQVRLLQARLMQLAGFGGGASSLWPPAGEDP